MNISIEYCMEWNYEPRALSLRDVLKEEFPSSIFKMIKSGGGVFEVEINGHLNIFSKKRTGRFPETYEVIKTIRDAITERRIG